MYLCSTYQRMPRRPVSGSSKLKFGDEERDHRRASAPRAGLEPLQHLPVIRLGREMRAHVLDAHQLRGVRPEVVHHRRDAERRLVRLQERDRRRRRDVAPARA